jgi:hypothetical protein
MTEMQLNGFAVQIDDDDAERVLQRKWYVRVPEANTPYCYTWVYTGGKVIATSLHRFITNMVGNNSAVIDHIDHNGLNNQKANLRVCSILENAWNKKRGRNNTSGYKGVSWKNDKWCARIMKNRESYDMGSYDSIEEAAFAYDVAALHLFGEFSCINFDKSLYIDVDVEKEYNARHYTPTCMYRGVVKRHSTRYETNVCDHRKVLYLGSFPTAEQAAIAYDAKAFELLSSAARLNFPERVVDGVYNKEMKCN